ncbi:hypothetical protein IQ07DRAFT_182217 [Pyrenochaeta sp. DS3sAY3a]|nr:hypothetical protein IQ07DRAFT_182217 [Pyrenochaeta sp. DS3sAY3a]
MDRQASELWFAAVAADLMRPTRGESVTRSLCHHCQAVPNRQAAERANQIRRAGETRPAGMQGPRCSAQLAMAAEIASATGDGGCGGHSSLRDEGAAGEIITATGGPNCCCIYRA